MEPTGTSEVIGWNRRISPLSAALINSTFIQGFELDDWHSEAPLHSNSIILPALFAATEHLYKLQGDETQAKTKIDGKNFLLAYLLGLEVGPRVGNALYGADMLTRGWHSGAVFGPAVSSIATCKMLGLSAGTMEDALGIACTQACGLMSAQFESEVKRMQHGFAARNGLLAALLARGGYVGIKKVLEREYGGYLAMFGQGSGKDPLYKVDEVTKGFGEKWQTWGVRVKPYSAMAGTHATVDCVRKLQAEHPEKMKQLGDIESIRLEMGEAAFHHGGWKAERPLTSTGAQMSNAYVAATQLVDGQVLPAQFRQDKLESDEVWSLVSKTSCEYSKGFDTMSAQRATITFKDKSTVTAMVNGAKGVDPALTNEEIVEKWRLLTKGVIDDERMERIETLCLNFEAMEDVTELLDLLAATTKNPIE
jgi:aconitate decarboxylase